MICSDAGTATVLDRTLLVTRVLADRGVAVAHILDDGRLEHHAATMRSTAGQIQIAAQRSTCSAPEMK